MATRMQQRRGTASQWTSANPVLNAGEMGWESDTNKFKIGDGTNHWADLDYFIDANSTVNPSFGTSIVFEGATADSYETTLAVTDPTADRTITFPNATGTVVLADGSGNVTVSGDLTVSGTTTTINSTTINATTGIVFEGTTADDYETTLTVTNPTADRVITFPNADGTVQLRVTDISDTEIGYLNGVNGAIQTQIDTKLASADASTTYETIANVALKAPLASPTFTGAVTLDTGANLVFEGATADGFETTIQVTDPTADRTITIPNVTGTVITTGNLGDITNTGTFTGSITIEGATADGYETVLQVTDPTADRTISFPDADGTVALVETVNTSLSGYVETSDIGGVSGVVGLDSLLNAIIPGTSIIIEGATDNNNETTLTVADPTADRTITFPDATGTVQLRVTDVDDTEIGYLNGVTSAIQTQLDDKSTASKTETLTNKTLTSPVINTPTGITKTDVGLANVDNTTDANKPVSTATQTALDLKANLAGATFTGAVSGTDLTLSGNLTVNGTTTNLNSTNLVIEDKNIVLGDTTTPTDTTADGGGITLKGTTDKTFNWVDATDAWTSSEHINLASGKTLKYNGTDLVASQSGNSGKYLTTDGTSTSWATVSGYLAPTLGSTSIASGATVTTIAGLTLTSPVLNTPTLTLSTSTSTTEGVIAWNSTLDKIIVGDGTTAREFASSTVQTNAQIASYTTVLADKDKVIEMSNASANNLTIPLNSSVAYPIGTVINVVQTGVGQTTVVATVGVTINGTPGLKLRAQWSGASLIKRGTDTWVLIGDISA